MLKIKNVLVFIRFIIFIYKKYNFLYSSIIFCLDEKMLQAVKLAKNIKHVLGTCLECSYQRFLSRHAHYFHRYKGNYFPVIVRNPALTRRTWLSYTTAAIFGGGHPFVIC